MRAVAFINSIGYTEETLYHMIKMSFHTNKDACTVNSEDVYKVASKGYMFVYYLGDARNGELKNRLYIQPLDETSMTNLVIEYAVEFTTDLTQFCIFCYKGYGTRSSLHFYDPINKIK